MGFGSVGFVVKATDKKPNNRVAIERMVKCSNEQERLMAMKEIRYEIASLVALRGHPNICQLMDHFDQDNKYCVIANFGLATNCKHPLIRDCGSIPYMALEMLLKSWYDKSVDIWSFGCLVYLRLVDVAPVERFISQMNLDGLSMDAKDLLMKMLQENPSK
ncbi:hypothetical protein THRCLA_10379 [Thraustotheca clavata]|uniref:Protein kinase domain-containing protein n=1 Tax=Thraustotheca clavata TaxID=74557 RepID=A0A1V9YRP1_9STRA|nr:hypothetical protein THRCLA_10379 [Thraustotheca clavata]